MNPFDLTPRERIANLVARVLRRGQRDPWDAPYKPLPEQCPICDCRIEQRGERWHCVGLKNRAEVERYQAYPGDVVPESIQQRDPCGWSGAASDFGRRWV